MKRLSIAFLTADDPRDKRAWSGTNHFLWRTLQAHAGEVHLLGPFTPQPQKFFGQVVNVLSLKLTGKRFDYRHSAMFRRAFGRHFSALLRKGHYDVVVVSGSTATAAGLRTALPVIYLNDRCIPGALGYHHVLQHLWGFSQRQSVETDRRAIANSRFTVYSSDWAADAAVNIQGFPRTQIQVIPFGANLETDPGTPAELAFPPQQLKLLFAGVHWEDKGGPVAFAALQHLLAAGIAAELVVCGCVPPVQHPNMRVLGFLNKNNPAEFAQLLHEFNTSHFFVLPTRYEAYGLVFCEAAAYGLPALAPATGGIPTIIRDGETGFLLPVGADGAAYAEKMITVLRTPGYWQQLRNNARQRYTDTLNWERFASAFTALLARI